MHRMRRLALVLATTLAGCGAAPMSPPTDPAPRLYRVILQVGDIEGAAAFYAELLGRPGERVSPGRHYFDCGGTILALLDPAADGDGGGARPLPDHVYLAVRDLDAAFARAQRLGGLSQQTGDGGLPMGRIAVRPWGERSFYLHDPWGNPLCFVDQATLFTGG